MPVAARAAVAYLLVAIAATWPLTRGISHDVPWDLGDPLLVMWILAWDCEQILRLLGGDLSAARTFFDANIFYPVPLTLAHSEHLIAQALQVLPVYAVTGNPILAYNLLFLSTWVLSGVGMFLLVREFTGNAIAAFVAGLLFAFAPYRLPQSGHLHVLSSQWMPFALFGLARYFRSGRRLPLVGAGVALALQSLSSGYYLLFFAPMAAGYAVWEIACRKLWRDIRVWRDLTTLGAGMAAVTLPFLLPYAALREQWPATRALSEVSLYSADIYSYATAFVEQRIWGDRLRLFPKPEGELFPGLVPLVLAGLGLVAVTGSGGAIPRIPGPRRWLGWFLAVAVASHAVAAVLALTLRRVTFDAGLFELRISNVNQMLLRGVVAFALLLMVSPGIRARTTHVARECGFFVLALVAAAWLSLGPTPQAFGRPIEVWSPYLFLYEHMPAFDGLRVPARLAMLVALALAVLAGFGAQAVARRRGGLPVLLLACGFFLLEATHSPFTLNGMTEVRGLATPEARIRPPREAPAVYRQAAGLPAEAVLIELPLGQPDHDLRAVYYSTVHWRRIVNGYSGFFPPHYGQLATALSEIPRHPELSIDALRASGATHAIVHEAGYLQSEGVDTSTVLRDAGARELFRDGSDVLLRLSP